MQHDIFISYSSRDKDAAQAICHVLEDKNMRCWMAPRDIPFGSQYGDIIEDAIKACKVLVVVFSENALSSQWVNGELNVAFEEQKVIIPFRLDQTPLKGQTRVMLNQRHWIDAFPDYKTKFSDLVTAVGMALGNSFGATVPKSTSDPSKIGTKSKWKKPIIITLSIFAILCVMYMVLQGVMAKPQQREAFSYDKGGLKIGPVSDLTLEQEEALKSILDDMVLVEGGTFIMGNDYSQPEYLTKQDSLSINPHQVKVSKFYISRNEMTNGQWAAFASIANKNNISGNEKKAVENISWVEANNLTDSLSSITKLEFSLPTEAQWEYAAKGGKYQKGDLFSGFTDAQPRLYAWTVADGLQEAQEVGLRQKNDLGLYDMTGNVSEWCKDYYAPYTKEEVTDPSGPEKEMYKIYRGGDYLTPNLQDMKVTTRYYAAPFVTQQGLGLRLVINVP